VAEYGHKPFGCLCCYVIVCSFCDADPVAQKTPFGHEGGVSHIGGVTVMFY
jgi:hypothetical protein